MKGLALALGLAALACEGDDITRFQPGTQFVSARDNAFTPATITVDRGLPVRWTNAGLVYHTVVADSVGWFDSGLISPRYWFEVRFDNAGTFFYHCSQHPDMTGTIVVQ